MKKIFTKDIKPGTSLSSYFLVVKKENKFKKNGEVYLHVVLADKTGSLDANVWDNIEAVTAVLDQTPIVFVDGDASEYNGRLQCTIRAVRAARANEYDEPDLFKMLPDTAAVWKQIVGYLSEIEQPHLCMLRDSFMSDATFRESFERCPGGIGWHHAYRGGLLQHTYEVVRIAREMCVLHPEVNQDLVLVGAFLHDIGKIHELTYALGFEYSDCGRLVGHICIGFDMMNSRIRKIPDFPDDLSLELQHIILSHQGEYEQRSPVLPQTIEACIVYHADNLSSQTHAFKSVVYGARPKGETWSKWFSIINRQLLLRDERDGVI